MAFVTLTSNKYVWTYLSLLFQLVWSSFSKLLLHAMSLCLGRDSSLCVDNDSLLHNCHFALSISNLLVLKNLVLIFVPDVTKCSLDQTYTSRSDLYID